MENRDAIVEEVLAEARGIAEPAARADALARVARIFAERYTPAPALRAAREALALWQREIEQRPVPHPREADARKSVLVDLMRAFALGGDAETAAALVAQLELPRAADGVDRARVIEAAFDQWPANWGLDASPDVDALLEHMLDIGEVATARRLVALGAPGPLRLARAVYIASRCATDDAYPDHAEACFEEALALAAAEGYPSGMIRARYVDYLAVYGLIDARALEEARKDDCPPHVLARLIAQRLAQAKRQGSMNDFREAIYRARAIPEAARRATEFARMAEAIAKDAERDPRKAALDEAVDAAGSIAEPYDRALAFARAARAAGRMPARWTANELLAEAVAAASAMPPGEGERSRADALAKIAEEAAHGHLFASALEVAKSIESAPYRSVAGLALARIFTAQARRLGKGLPPDGLLVNSAAAAIELVEPQDLTERETAGVARLLAEKRGYFATLALLRPIPDASKSKLLFEIIDEMCRAGDLDEAARAAALALLPVGRAAMLRAVQELHAKGRVAEAVIYLKETLPRKATLAPELDGGLRDLAEAMIPSHDFIPLAEEIARLLREQDAAARDRGLAQLAARIAFTAPHEAALRATRLIGRDEARIDALAAVAARARRDGRAAEAHALAREALALATRHPGHIGEGSAAELAEGGLIEHGLALARLRPSGAHRAVALARLAVAEWPSGGATAR